MTLLARRVYYSLTILVFVIAAPIIVLTANGYQWAGWRFGFVPTGALVVSVSPRATVSLDGQVLQETDKLTKRLRPGQYEVALSRPGYAPWQRLVSIKPRSATVIGPITLFPPTLAMKQINQPAERVLLDQRLGLVAAGQTVDGGWSVRQIWPGGRDDIWQVAAPPAAIAFSPKKRTVVIDGTEQSYVFTTDGGREAWVLDRLDQVFWGGDGDAVFYGRDQADLLRLDALAETATVVNQASSAAWLGRQIWSTQSAAGQTVLRRQSPADPEPTPVQELTGRWLIELGPDGVLIVRNQDNRDTLVFRSADLAALAQGPVDRWWWPTTEVPPLWQSGTQLLTLDDQSAPLLLERGPEEYQAVFWIVPNHIIAAQIGSSLTIRSVSDRQGRGRILQQELPTGASLVAINRDDGQLVFKSDNPAVPVFTLSWR